MSDPQELEVQAVLVLSDMVLRTEPRSSARIVCVFHRAVFPAPVIIFLTLDLLRNGI